MEDITGFFTSNVSAMDTPEKGVPKLDLWIELRASGRAVISGVISRHPKYPDGMRILTSSLEGYTSDQDCKIYAMTKNSKYELGEKLEVGDPSRLISASGFAEVVTDLEKETIF